MITFVTSIFLLILGYLIYGSFVEKNFGVDSERKTPCFTKQDGVDYLPMASWRVYLIQFLNIAGTGPIFGAIQGILFGPAAYLWIVLGCIFGGAVHDFMSGMISLRKDGASLPEIIGQELGNKARIFILVFSLVLMILVGAVFVTTPAGLLSKLTGGAFGVGDSDWMLVWIVVIFAYYILATILPIDKLIGKIYPLFGIALIIMAVGVLIGIFTNVGAMPEITDAFSNHHPKSSIPLFPGVCITIACGAVSGFHATQSPMMARCMQNEKLGRPVFYGAMITEGLVALIWAAAAIKFADSLNVDGDTPYQKLLNAMTNPENGRMNPAIIVNQICHTWIGKVGAVLAILGVVAAPITSGDTAFRSARLIASDFLHIKQNKVYKRLILSIPLFLVAFILMMINFDVLWRYFAWTNQTLSVFTLWAITVWLARHQKNFYVGLVPALWMTMVCSSYILVAPEGFQLQAWIGYLGGGLVTLFCLSYFIWWYRKNVEVKR